MAGVRLNCERSAPNQIGKKRDWVAVRFTQGGGLCPGLLSGRPVGAPEAAGMAGRLKGFRGG